MARIIRTEPTTSTIHKGTPIVVILYYLPFSGKIPMNSLHVSERDSIASSLKQTGFKA